MIFYDKQYLKYFKYEIKYATLEGIFPYVSFFETFASNRRFICNHRQPLNNKIGDIYREGLV